jgi:hypothetical protein
MMGQRDLNIFPLYGEYKWAGALEGPLFPSNSLPILVASIGADGGRAGLGLATGQGVTGAAIAGWTGTIASSIVGATSVAYTTGSGGTPVAGQFVQVDVNGAGTVSEVRKITSVVGTANPFTLNLDVALNYAHAGATATKQVQAPFTHSIVQQNLLDSLTLEKEVGGYQSEQYQGCRVAKFSTKIAAGNTEADFTADVIAQGYNILSSPSAVSVVNESPFVFAEATLTLAGTARLELSSISIDIENGLKETYTLAGQHAPQFITPVTRKISGAMTLVFSSLNDATYGYYSRLFNESVGSGGAGYVQPGALSLAFQHPGASGSGLTLSLNRAALKKYADDIKMQDVVMAQLDYEAYLDLGATPINTISGVAVNGVWLPY